MWGRVSRDFSPQSTAVLRRLALACATVFSDVLFQPSQFMCYQHHRSLDPSVLAVLSSARGAAPEAAGLAHRLHPISILFAFLLLTVAICRILGFIW